jgi:ribosomal protein S18 acetylase RimI-like enzyme
VTLVVRPAEPGDAEELAALVGAVRAEPQGWLVDDAGRGGVTAERRYLRFVAGHPDAAVLVAELDGALVGRLSVARDLHPSSAHVADIGLVVGAAYRRRGVGRALLEAVEEWAGAAGVLKLELHVLPHNEAAISLYESAGYEREGYRAGQYRNSDSTLVDVILMAKQLQQ